MAPRWPVAARARAHLAQLLCVGWRHWRRAQRWRRAAAGCSCGVSWRTARGALTWKDLHDAICGALNAMPCAGHRSVHDARACKQHSDTNSCQTSRWHPALWRCCSHELKFTLPGWSKLPWALGLHQACTAAAACSVVHELDVHSPSANNGAQCALAPKDFEQGAHAKERMQWTSTSTVTAAVGCQGRIGEFTTRGCAITCCFDTRARSCSDQASRQTKNLFTAGQG